MLPFGWLQGKITGKGMEHHVGRKDVRREIETTLAVLGVEYVDIFVPARVTPETPIEETVDELKALVQEGKIRAIGLSEASAASIARASAVHPIACLQTEFGPMETSIEQNGILEACRKNNVLVLAYGATPIDLGLPLSWSQFCSDVRLGATMWAASLVPIYAIMAVLNFTFAPTEGHPLVERLLEHHSFGMMAAAAFTAVVAAPLYEEAAFRLVLQGWLERVEFFRRPRAPIADLEASAIDSDGVVRRSEFLYAPVQVQWLPIAVSGALFGLAHWGHGVSPAPLVLLGFILGYAYQRTHRIVPCITCHVMFNGFTMAMLALQFAEEM